MKEKASDYSFTGDYVISRLLHWRGVANEIDLIIDQYKKMKTNDYRLSATFLPSAALI